MSNYWESKGINPPKLCKTCGVELSSKKKIPTSKRHGMYNRLMLVGMLVAAAADVVIAVGIWIILLQNIWMK